MPTHREWPGVIGPAGVEEQGIGTIGFPRNVGDPVVSTLIIGSGRCLTQTSRPPVGVGPCGRYEGRRKEWYRQAKETKCGGMSGRESEHVTVPRKAGNRPNGTRWREGRAGLRNLCEER